MNIQQRRLKVKVCGMRHPGNIAELSRLPIDMMGFIFYPQSPRYVGELSPRSLSEMPDSIRRVGVFVNETESKMLSVAKEYGLQLIQLHGTESVDVCKRLKDRGYEIIKAFNVKSDEDFDHLSAYSDVCDYFLFDTKSSSFGGSGIQYNWKILDSYRGNTPFFLSGGIGISDKSRIGELDHSRLYAVDLNSKFEISPGMKDVALIRRMIQE